MWKLSVFLLALFGLLHEGSSLRCYSCDGAKCKDPERKECPRVNHLIQDVACAWEYKSGNPAKLETLKKYCSIVNKGHGNNVCPAGFVCKNCTNPDYCNTFTISSGPSTFVPLMALVPFVLVPSFLTRFV